MKCAESSAAHVRHAACQRVDDRGPNVTKCFAPRLEPRLWGNLKSHQPTFPSAPTCDNRAARRMRCPRSMMRLSTASTTVPTLRRGGCGAARRCDRRLRRRSRRRSASSCSVRSSDAAGWYSGMPETVQEVYLPVGATAPGERIHAWWWPAGLPGRAGRAVSPWRALEPHRSVEPHVAAAPLRILGVRHRLSRIRQERRRAAERGHRLRGRARRPGNGWSNASPIASRRFIYGHSLGGAVAIDLAAQLSGRSRERARADRRVVVHVAPRARVGYRAMAGCHGNCCFRRSSIRSARSSRSRMPVLIVHGDGGSLRAARV